MEEFFDVGDFFSGYPAFFIPSRFAWGDFHDFISNDMKGDLSESKC